MKFFISVFFTPEASIHWVCHKNALFFSEHIMSATCSKHSLTNYLSKWGWWFQPLQSRLYPMIRGKGGGGIWYLKSDWFYKDEFYVLIICPFNDICLWYAYNFVFYKNAVTVTSVSVNKYAGCNYFRKLVISIIYESESCAYNKVKWQIM